LPGDHIPAEPVEDGDQIHEPLDHGQIGNIRTPDLIGMAHGHAAEQIGIDPMPWTPNRRSRLGINRLQPHEAHEALDPFMVHLGGMQTKLAGNFVDGLLTLGRFEGDLELGLGAMAPAGLWHRFLHMLGHCTAFFHLSMWSSFWGQLYGASVTTQQSVT